MTALGFYRPAESISASYSPAPRGDVAIVGLSQSETSALPGASGDGQEIVVIPPAPAVVTPDVSSELISAELAGSPLESMAAVIISAARASGVDPRIIVALAVLESSRGVNACGGNFTGLDSCHTTYADFGEGARATAETLAGPAYQGLTPAQTLAMWKTGDPHDTSETTQQYVANGLAVYAEMGGR
jgi:hypothetical protein